MTMKSYNGFTGAQRNKAQRWLQQQWSTGALTRPVQCSACTQTQGRIDAHAEDYSEPFAAGKTDQFHLCYTCHMAVHCRHRNREAWTRYKAMVRDGYRHRACRSFPDVLDMMQGAEPQGVDPETGPWLRVRDAVKATPLDFIAD